MESHSARKAASRARNRTVTSRAHNRRSNSQDTPPKEATRKTSADSVDHAEKSVAQPAQEVNDVSVPGRGEAEMEHQSTDAIQAPIDSQPVNSEAEELLAQPSGQEHSLHGPSAYSTMESAVQEPTIPEEAVSTAEETAINDERSESSKAVTPETPLGLEKQVIKIPAPVDETEVEDLAVKLSAVRISPPPEAETDW